MNKFISSTFDTIKSAEADYRGSVQSALLDYRRTMEKATTESKQYKDETAYIDSKKATARRVAQFAIKSAENGFTGVLKAEVASLRDDLHKHLTTRPSAAFLDALRLYYDFDITPSHAEIEALMELNGGNTLGYRAINRTLEKTGAEWRIDAPDSAAYEADLAALEKLVYGHFMYGPEGFHHEMVEVFGGMPHLRLREDGSTYDLGDKWDNTSILLASSDYKGRTGAIDAMSERWSSTVLPSLKHVTAYEDKTDPKTGETVTAAQQLAGDIKATAHAPEITKPDAAAEWARERARKRAETAAQAREDAKKFIL